MNLISIRTSRDLFPHDDVRVAVIPLVFPPSLSFLVSHSFIV